MRAAAGAVSALVLAACGERANDAPAPVVNPEVALGRAATLAAACSGCHVSGGKALADLGGRSSEALFASLSTYRTDPDGTTVMHRLARGYSEADIEAIATYLAEAE